MSQGDFNVPFYSATFLPSLKRYDRLDPIDLAAYRERYGDIGLIDLILEAEGDDVRRYQVGKQPDALMLIYLLSAEELRSILARLGYEFDADAVRATIDFYSSRTTHGSSLSRVGYAWISARRDRASSWRYLTDSLATDSTDAHHGTTREGIHLGAMAGTIDIFTRCYTGLEMRSNALLAQPAAPRRVGIDFIPRRVPRSRSVDHRRPEPRGDLHPARKWSGQRRYRLNVRGTPYMVHRGDRVTHDLLLPFAHQKAPHRSMRSPLKVLPNRGGW